jgi:hypothetical protein
LGDFFAAGGTGFQPVIFKRKVRAPHQMPLDRSLTNGANILINLFDGCRSP